MFESILHHFSFACGMILIIFAILHLSHKNKETLNYLSACFFLLIGFLVLYIWSFMTGIIFYIPWLLYSDIGITFLIAPVIYLYITEISGGTLKFSFITILHFAPAIMCFIFFITYIQFNPSILTFYRTHLSVYPDYNLTPVIAALSTVADLWLVIYLIVGMRNIFQLLKNRSNRYIKEMRILMFLVLFVIFSCGFLFFAHIIKENGIIVAFIFMFCFAATLYFIYSIRYPGFGHRLIREAKKIRYENSLPESIDVKIILRRLNYLMETEKVYRDDEISLSKLSSMLKISSHQLSQIINENIGINFRRYVNAYRIDEAKRLLVTKPDMSILETAFVVGFNSKPSFNNFFLRETGITPREYRKNKKKRNYL